MVDIADGPCSRGSWLRKVRSLSPSPHPPAAHKRTPSDHPTHPWPQRSGGLRRAHRPGAAVSKILEDRCTLTSTSASKASIPLRADDKGRLFGRRSSSTRRWSSCWKKVRKRPKSLAQAQFAPARGRSVRRFYLILCVCRRFLTALPAIFLVIVALSMEALLLPTSS